MGIKTIHISLVFFLSIASLRSYCSDRPPLEERFYQIKFNDHLKIARDLKLAGNVASVSVSFTCESRWRPIIGTSLHLIVQHTEELDGKRSVLSISLNNGVLKKLRLDEQNEEPTEVDIQISPELMRQKNQLLFSVEQISAGKTPPSQLWSLISNRSFVLVHCEQEPLNLDLGLLPLPMLDPYSYRQQRLSILLPKSPTSTTLEATALLVQRLSRQITAQPVLLETVESIHAARGPLLIIGTLLEQPAVRMFQETGGFVIQEQNGEAKLSLPNGGVLAGSEGLALLASKSTDDAIPVMMVTANSPRGVLDATRSLLDPACKTAGRLARLSRETERLSLRPREWPGYIPPQDRFTLAALGFESLELSSQQNRTLTVLLDAPPDARFFNYGHEITLDFKLNARYLRPESSMEIRLNNTLLGHYMILQVAKGLCVSIRIQVPSSILGLQNRLDMVWHDSSGGNTEEPFCWLLSSSEFFLPRDYHSELPDLGLLQFSFYPFSLRADLSDTVILVPKEIDKEMFGTLLELSCLLGRLLPGEHPDFQIKRTTELTEPEKAAFHFICFDVGNNSDRLQKLTVNPKSILLRESLRNTPIVQESISPWNSKKYVLTFAARSDIALQQAVAECFSEKKLRQLTGDTALLTPTRAIGFRLGPRQTTREYSYLTHVKAWLRVNWMALPIILAAAGGLLFAGLRLALIRYRSGKGPGQATS